MAAQQNNSKTISDTVNAKPTVTTTPTGVQSNISVTKKVNEYYKKFTSLNPSAEPLPQGDGTIRISPFDDYIIFTLFDETGENGDLVDKPIDLSNVGILTLVFVGENDEIRIPNWTQVQDVDLSQGQVLFRIDKENSKKILALDNQNFYISTRMEDESGASDESVLYTGTFLTVQDSAKETLTAKNNAQALLYSEELAKLQAEIEKLNNDIADMLSIDEDQNATIAGLEASNLELTNEVALLSEQLGTTEADLVLKNAKLQQARAELLKQKRQRIDALVKIAKGTNNQGKKQQFYKQAASNLQEFNTSQNPVTQFLNIRPDLEQFELDDRDEF